MKSEKFYLAVAAAAILFSACDRKPAQPPVVDSETESSVEAVFANQMITDIHMMCAYLGERNYRDINAFYMPIPGSFDPDATNGNVTAGDNNGNMLYMGFNNTRCLDGKLRAGTIFMDYSIDVISNPGANPNSRYYRDYGFVGAISLTEYKVNGWRIKLYDDNARAYVYNRLTTNQYNPAVTKLSWTLAGKFLLEHPSDPSKNLVWNGKLVQTLQNTNDTRVFASNRQSAITWSLATLHYHGEVEGETADGVPFKMEINQATPMVRDFSCTPDKVSEVNMIGGTAGQQPIPTYAQYHPFVKGIASFTTGYNTSKEKYPRQIYMGNEGSPQLQWQCDDVGEVMIKGIHYPVNFRK